MSPVEAPSRRRRLFLLVSIVVLAGAAVVFAASGLHRIGSDEIGASAAGWMAPGRHWTWPWAPPLTIARAGRLDLGSIAAPTPAGATRTVRVRAEYVLQPDGASRELAAAASREKDLAAALRPYLAAALREALHGTGAAAAAPGANADAPAGPGGSLEPASARSSGAALPRTGTRSDRVGAALAGAMERLGVTVSALDWQRQTEAPGPAVVPLAPPARKRILLVGLDGADWDLIDPLMREGKLPNLARLVRSGARAPLRSYDPMISPLIWTTIATGVGPDVHGVADFLVSDAASGMQIPITSRFRRVKALWNIFSDSGLRSGFVGWWATYPAESINGVLVTDLMGFSLLRPAAEAGGATKGITSPDSYYAAVRPRMLLPDKVPYEEVTRFIHASRAEYDASMSFRPGEPAPRAPTAPSRAGATSEEASVEAPRIQDPVWLVRRAVAMTRNYGTIAADLLSQNLDVVGVYFEGIDLMGHRFQHCLPPRIRLCTPDDFEKYQSAVTSFYAFQDEILGELLSRAGDRTVVVVSDHGFRSGADRPADYLPYTTGQPVEWHREYGILLMSGPGVRPGASIQAPTVYDVAPTILYLSGLPASEEMPGRVLREALEPADLAKHPPARIASFEDVGSARSSSSEAASLSSPQAQREMVENLQALGYVGPIAAPKPPTGRASSAASSAGAAGAGAGAAAGAGGESERVMYHRNMATFYLKAGRAREAEDELRSANRIQPLPKTFELLSEIRAGRGDVDGAVQELEEGLKTFPDMDQDAVLWMMDLRLASGRPDLAAALLETWRSRLTRPAILATCQGKLAAARGDPDGAIVQLLHALDAEPALAQAAIAVAPLLDARGRLPELEPYLQRALAGERRIDEYQNLLGIIRLKSGRPAEAMASIGQALDVDPANPRFLDNFAAAAIAARQPARALERYAAATRDGRASAAAWAGYGRLLGMAHRPADAVRAFTRAHELGDAAASTYLGYAAALYETGDKARSRDMLREGLKLFPADPSLISLSRRIG